MKITGRVARQILLLSLLILIAPMLLFPERLGTEMAKASLPNAICELAYYGAVIFLFNWRMSLLQMAQAAGICLIYRLLLGAVFGLLIAAMYSMNLTVSLTLGMSSYLPAILLHIAATPFMLKPAMRELLLSGMDRHLPVREPLPADVQDHGRTSMAVSVEKRVSSSPPAASREPGVRAAKELRTNFPPTAVPADTNGFDRATRYIGEAASVQLAAVVDHEGLLLGHFRRGPIEAEDWAPFSLLFSDINREILNRAGWGSPEKIDILLKDKRIVVAREESFSLMVIAERQFDDFINIRVNQALETIRKYAAERYSRKLFVNVERTYVSST